MSKFAKEPWSKKKSRFSILPIALSALIGAGAIAGSVTSIWHMARNYQPSAEFSKSVMGKVEVDPVAFDEEKTKEVAEQNMKEAARRLSNWLRDNGQDMYDVSYETYGDSEGGLKGYLNAQFNIDKVKSHLSWEEDKEYDNDEYLSFFGKDGFNTNNKTLVYRWYITSEQQTLDPEYTIINFNDCFHLPKGLDDTKTKVLSNLDGKWGVMYTIDYKDEFNQNLLNTIYNDMLHAYEDSQKKSSSNDDPPTISDWQKPRLYVINNFEEMVNEANYHLMNYRANDDGNDHDYRAIYENSDQRLFANEYITQPDDKSESKRSQCSALIEANVLEDYHDHSQGHGLPAKNMDVLRWIDPTPGTVKYSIFNKYVDDIITYDSENWKTYFPAKLTDVYKQEVASTWDDEDATNLKFFWHPYDSKTSATAKLQDFISYSLPVKVKQIELTKEGEGKPGASINLATFKQTFVSQEMQPRFIDSLFGGNALVGWLSLGFLIYLIGLAVILAALYRTTGVISWICLMFMLSMSMLIASLATFTISMTFLFGMFTLSLLGFMTALGICERMKRRLKSNEDTNLIVNKTFKKSLFPTLDLSIVSLLFGICFTYIAPTNLNILGLVLIAGAFMIFLIMYMLNGGLHLLFFNNKINRNSFKLLGQNSNEANQALYQGNNLVPSSLDTSKLEFSYYSSMSKKNIKLFSKQTFIMLLVLLAILIGGIVLFSIFGFVTQRLFHTPATIVIKWGDDLLTQDWFTAANLQWLSYTHFGGYWRFSIESVASQQAAINILLGHFEPEQIGVDISIAEFAGSSNLDALQYALISIVVASALTSIYGGIRTNFVSFVPLLVGSVIMPVMMLALASFTLIKFDQIIVLGLILTSIVNCAMTLNIMSSIQDSWSRNEAFTREEFRFITSTALKNCWQYIWVYAIGYALFIICFGIFAPYGCEYIVILLFIGGLVTLFVLPFTISYLQYYFLCIRNNLLGYRAERNKGKVVINLDDIDEQSIEGINKFTKHKAIPKIETKQEVVNEK